MHRALDHTEGPVFVEFAVAKEHNVYPMIPSGQTVNEMIDTPEPITVPAGEARDEELMIVEKG
ncbi:MAG: hypothetical protein OEM41_08505, partial [Ignavibacteria bacterium]|nr:hypothetical protein [Ignavibacteria bacterium]